MSSPVDFLSRDELRQFRALLDQGLVAELYAGLAARGYRYARLAAGVVSGGTFSGRIALEFLAKTAEGEGIELSEDRLNLIRWALAKAYLDTLERQVSWWRRGASREASADEVWAFHSAVFVEQGLGPDAWTLNTPFTMMNAKERSAYWSAVLRGAGDFAQELAVGVAADFVVKQAAIASDSEREGELARSWLHRLHNLDTYLAAAEATSLQLEQLAERLTGVGGSVREGRGLVAMVMKHLHEQGADTEFGSLLSDLEGRILGTSVVSGS